MPHIPICVCPGPMVPNLLPVPCSSSLRHEARYPWTYAALFFSRSVAPGIFAGCRAHCHSHMSFPGSPPRKGHDRSLLRRLLGPANTDRYTDEKRFFGKDVYPAKILAQSCFCNVHGTFWANSSVLPKSRFKCMESKKFTDSVSDNLSDPFCHAWKLLRRPGKLSVVR